MNWRCRETLNSDFDRVLFAHLLMDRFVCSTLSHVVQRNKHKLQEGTVL